MLHLICVTYKYINTYITFNFALSVDGYLDSLDFLTIMNNAPMEINMQVLRRHMSLFFLSRYLLVELLAPMVTIYLT